MPKLSDIKIDITRFKGKGLRPWTNVPAAQSNSYTKAIDNIIAPSKKRDKKGMTNPPERDDKGMTNLKKGMTNLDKGMTNPPERDDKGMTNLDKGMTNLDKGMTNLDKGMTNLDKGMTNLDKGMTNPPEMDENKGPNLFSYAILTGLQKKCVDFIFESMKLNRGKSSSPMTAKHISKLLEVGLKSIKKTISRLKNKGVLASYEKNIGRKGWVKYCLSKSIYQEIIKANYNKSRQESYSIIEKPSQDVLTSSSSSIYNITTTELPEDWAAIDISPLMPIRFSETQIKQLFASNATNPKIIQESIHHFAFGQENNEKTQAYKNPLNVLMGVLRKGQAWVEPKYEQPKDKALRELLERRKKEKGKREAMIKELIELEFPEWREKLSETQIRKIVPKEARDLNLDAPVTSALRTYFIKNIILPKLDIS